MKTLLAAVAVLAAGSAFATPSIPQTTDKSPIVVARADDATRELRRGRGRDDGVNHMRRGADDATGELRRGRGRDDGVNHKRHGADDPVGDDRGRRGRGRDDPLPHA